MRIGRSIFLFILTIILFCLQNSYAQHAIWPSESGPMDDRHRLDRFGQAGLICTRFMDESTTVKPKNAQRLVGSLVEDVSVASKDFQVSIAKTVPDPFFPKGVITSQIPKACDDAQDKQTYTVVLSSGQTQMFLPLITNKDGKRSAFNLKRDGKVEHKNNKCAAIDSGYEITDAERSIDLNRYLPEACLNLNNPKFKPVESLRADIQMSPALSTTKLKRGVSYPFRLNFLSTSKSPTSLSIFKCEFLDHILSLNSSFKLSNGPGKCEPNLFWKFTVTSDKPTQSNVLILTPKKDAPLGLHGLNFLFSDFGRPTNVLSELSLIEVVP